MTITPEDIKPGNVFRLLTSFTGDGSIGWTAGDLVTIAPHTGVSDYYIVARVDNPRNYTNSGFPWIAQNFERVGAQPSVDEADLELARRINAFAGALDTDSRYDADVLIDFARAAIADHFAR